MTRARTFLPVAAVGAALVTSVLALYAPVRGFAFVSFDDPGYVTARPIVQEGLTWAGVRWAFTTGALSNWHPLTWLAHMLDCELFGVAPGAHHLMSVGLHALNAVLLLLVLWRMTGALGASALVAALFALHPIQVESVAWVAERKNLLSGSFWMLSLAAYVRYARRPSGGRMVLVGVCFALGLLSKPSVVTLPFALLLLDVWPLRRLALAPAPGVAPGGRRRAEREAELFPARPMAALLREKGPLFAMALASSVATYLAAQRGGATVTMEVPLAARLGEALVSYVGYLRGLVLPTDLAFLYPHPGGRPFWEVAAAAAALALASGAALRLRAGWPWLGIGWLWFLGVLVPTSGLVPVGYQALADRYAYLPAIGVFVAVAFSARQLAQRRPALRPALVAACLLACAGLAWATARQLPHWRDSVALYSRAIAVTERNAIAHNNLSTELRQQRDLVGAETHAAAAVEAMPRSIPIRMNHGVLLLLLGRLPEAREAFARVLEADPDHAEAHAQHAIALARLGQGADAARGLEEALRRDPQQADARLHLARRLRAEGRSEEAAAQLAEARRLAPEGAQDCLADALALLRQGQRAAAAHQLDLALDFDPDSALALGWRAWLLATDPDPAGRAGPRALALATRAVARGDASDPLLLAMLAAAQAEAGQLGEARRSAAEAEALARARGQTGLVARLAAMDARFAAGEPYRDVR